jgi:hypothetical protein
MLKPLFSQAADSQAAASPAEEVAVDSISSLEAGGDINGTTSHLMDRLWWGGGGDGKIEDVGEEGGGGVYPRRLGVGLRLAWRTKHRHKAQEPIRADGHASAFDA